MVKNTKITQTLLSLCAAVAVTACAVPLAHNANESKVTRTMSAATAERIVRAHLSHSYPIAKRGAKFTVIELTPKQFRVVLYEKGEAKDIKEAIYKFGTGETLSISMRESSFFVDFFENKCDIHWYTKAEATSFADALRRLENLALQGKLTNNPEKSEDLSFKVIAAKYRASNPKPTLDEEARKNQVIAENAFDEKRYADALDYFDRALKIAPWWAQGHYNRALLLAQDNNMPDAIVEMKMYLELNPDAKDARAARDKMYVWEAKVEKAGTAAMPDAEAPGLPPTTHGEIVGNGVPGTASQ